jgi:signal transduction histidine kinase
MGQTALGIRDMATAVKDMGFETMEMSSILVVDDENGPRQALRMLLKEEHEVRLANSVAAAQQVVSEHPVDLVITDIRMPKQTGVDLLRWLKETHDDIEVIILTGYGQLETATKAVEYGAFAYLEKPFDNDTMLRFVREGLERRNREMERRRLEELALEANRFETVGRFISGILHDLGTPLSVIGSQIELITRTGPNDKTQHRLDMIMSQSQHCSELVRKAMSFLRYQKQSFTPLNLNEVAMACLEVARPVLAKQSVKVIQEFSPDIRSCSGDFVLVRQAVLNLIINACQAMEGGGKPCEVHVCTWEEDSKIFLSVRDTGPGVSPENRGRVFQTFFTTKASKGTGLGLAAVRNIMRRHNGTVSLRNVEGPGACFALTFPPSKTSDLLAN